MLLNLPPKFLFNIIGKVSASVFSREQHYLMKQLNLNLFGGLKVLNSISGL